MKAVVADFNQEKALVGAFSVIVQPVVEPMEHYIALVLIIIHTTYHQDQDVMANLQLILSCGFTPSARWSVWHNWS